MRVLVLSAAILAYASGAPSGALIPLAQHVGVAQTVILSASQPTISPGDLQAASIDAQVQAEDLARAVEDRARHLTEQVVETQNENAEEANELAKLKTEQQFWNEEEQKWQALEAVQTAQAKLEGEAAKNAEILAKAAIPIPTVSIAPIIQPELPRTAIVAPTLRFAVSPIAFATPGIVAPNIKSIDSKEPSIPKSESETVAAKAEETKTEGTDTKLESTPIVKATELYDGQSIVAQSLTQTHPTAYNAGISYYGPALRISNGLLAAPIAYVGPEAKFFGNSITQTHGFAPFIIRSAW